jgi:hypothetical protein
MWRGVTGRPKYAETKKKKVLAGWLEVAFRAI